LAPGTTGRLAARLGRRFFLHAGTPADPTDGGLSTTRLTDVATRGGWGEPARTRARRAAGGVGLVAAGAAAARLRSRSG
jgi:hypothetical protein